MTHQWVELTYMPVVVEEGTAEDGAEGLRISASPLSIALARDEAIYICWHCELRLDHQTFQTECSVEKVLDV